MPRKKPTPKRPTPPPAPRPDAGDHHPPAFRRPDKPLTPKHLAYMTAVRVKEIVLAVSPAGCGKTSLACAVAAELLHAGRAGRVVIARPLVQCDEDLGTLPGELRDKLDPYLAPLLAVFRDLLGRPRVEAMIRAGTLELCPLATMRGRTFDHAVVIVDEAQNATMGQLRMAMSRLGHGSRMVVCGDVEQVDLPYPSPLREAWALLSAPPRHPGFAFVELGEAEQLRPEIVNFVTRRLRAGR